MQAIHHISFTDSVALGNALHTIINQGRRIVFVLPARDNHYLVVSEPDNSDLLND